MISAAYVLPDAPPADGHDLASSLGWYHFTNFVMARAEKYPEAAHLAGFGWSDSAEALAHDLERIPHDPEIDPDLTAIAGQVLAAVRARPDGALEFRVSTGEAAGPFEGEPVPRASESRIFRERGFTGIDSHGHKWADGKQVKKGDDGSASTDKTGAAGGDEHEPAPELSDSDRADLTAGIDADVAALPADAQKEASGLVAKAKDLALTAAAKAMIWLHQFNESTIGKLVGEVVDGFFDSTTDMKKLGYNPSNSSGTASPRNADAVAGAISDLTGGMGSVSGHLVASIASKVLTKVFFWAKSKLAGTGKRESVEGDADGIDLWADLISQLLGHLAEEFGTGGAPDKDVVAKNLRALLGAK